MTEDDQIEQNNQEKREKILSPIWQADVLDQTRLRAHLDRGVLSHKNQQFDAQQLKAISQPIDSRIANTLITSQNNGLNLNVVKEIRYRLRQLAKHSNLLDPEDVKHYKEQVTRLQENFGKLERII